MKFLNSVRSSFTPLRFANFRHYLAGQSVSLIGTWMQATAQGWVVWELTHSPAALGTVAMLSTLPILLFGPMTGVWADRLDRRKLLIGSQTVAMLLAFSLAFLVQTGLVQLWHIYVLSFLLGIVSAVDFPAQQAFIGDLTGMGEVRKAVVVNAMVMQVSRMVGPALAGFVVGSLGAAVAFGINGLSFVAVIISLMVVRSQQVRRPSSGNFLTEFTEGLRFIRTQPRLQDVILYTVFVTFFGLSVMNILAAVADRVLHGQADTLGLLMAASGAGALVGAIVVVPIVQGFARTGIILGLCCAWAGTWFVFFSLSTWLPLSMLCLFIVSLTVPAVITTASGLLQTMAPPTMRARLLSVFTMVSFGIQPLASLVLGYSAQHLGPALAIRINGVAMVAAVLLLLGLRPALRRWESTPMVAAAVEVAP